MIINSSGSHLQSDVQLPSHPANRLLSIGTIGGEAIRLKDENAAGSVAASFLENKAFLESPNHSGDEAWNLSSSEEDPGIALIGANVPDQQPESLVTFAAPLPPSRAPENPQPPSEDEADLSGDEPIEEDP